MSIALFTIGFGRPELLYHQKRLLDKYLDEDFGLCLIDNTPGIMRNKMEAVCRDNGIGYLHTPGPRSGHDDGLNYAVSLIPDLKDDFVGFLDADIFPAKHTTLTEKIKKAGFYGRPENHPPTGNRYLWPGFCFFSKEWLGGRIPNFSGIRNIDKRLDGDCGSMLHTLFTPEDWQNMTWISLGERSIREQIGDNENIQSWGYQILDDWVHFMNSSHWMEVPDAQGRDRLLMQMIECL